MWYDVHTMGKSSFLTPVYLFSSIRAGSGKATMLANLAVHLNNLNQRVAVVDLDSDYPQKLLSSFPAAINLHEYTDLALLKEKSDSRYQKSFYFTDTSQISYFPATRLKEPSLLFSDTIFRDFLIQARASFDLLLLNFPAGPSHCEKVSEIISRTFLWRGSKPASVIVSLSDERSLVNLDKILQRNTALSYQLQENTLLLFNKVPSSPDEQNLSDSILNSIELRRLFTFPNTYIVAGNEEFPSQRISSVPAVLNPETYTQQTVAGLSRILSRLGNESSQETSEKSGRFAPVLDGELLEKLSPYLARIQQSVSKTLLMGKAEIQIFLEENAGAFRIRLRTSTLNRGLKSIQTNVPVEMKQKPVFRESPCEFSFSTNKSVPINCELAARIKKPVISFSPVFHFDDRFAWKTSISAIFLTTAFPNRTPCPSPIFFKPALDLQEIPSLAHILGFSRKKYKKQTFVLPEKTFSAGGVTHFFIPPEFDLATSYECLFKAENFADFSIKAESKVNHQSSFIPAYEFPDMVINDMEDLPDFFSRNKDFVPENDFLPRTKPDLPRSFSMVLRFNKLFQIIAAPESSFSHSELNWPVKFFRPPRAAGFLSHSFTADYFVLKDLPFTCHNNYIPAAAPEFQIQQAVSAEFDFCSKNETIMAKQGYSASLSLTCTGEPDKTHCFKKFDFTKVASNIYGLTAKILFSSLKHVKELFLGAPEYCPKKNLNISEQLIDHNFKYFTACEFPSRSFAYKNKTPRKPDFNLPVFFLQQLVEKTFKNLPERIALPEALVKQIFQVFITGFKPFEHRFKVMPESLAYSIFQARFKLSYDRGYRTSSNKSTYNANRLLDQLSSGHQFKLLNKGPVPCRNKAFTEKLADFSLHDQSFAVKADFPESIKNHVFSQSVDKHDCFRPLEKSLSWQINESLPACMAEQAICGLMENASIVPEPCFLNQDLFLSTIPVRSVLRNFHSFCSEPPLTLIDQTVDQIKKTYAHKDHLEVNSFNPLMELKEILIPIGIPMRVKQAEIPKIESQLQNEIHSIILPQKSPAVSQKPSFYSFAMHRPGKKPEMIINFPTVQNASLKFFDPESPPMATLKKDKLSCAFPTALDDYFANLLYNIRQQRQRAIDHQLKMQNSAYTDLLVTTDDSLEFAPALQFVERQSPATKNLKQNFNRSAFVVPKLKLRDLMNFAKQATERFASLNNRMQS